MDERTERDPSREEPRDSPGGPEEDAGWRERSGRQWGDALHDVQDAVGEMVGEVLEGVRDVASGVRRFPRMDVYRTGEEYRVLVDLPGVTKDDVEVSTLGGELSLRGERPAAELSEPSEPVRQERGHGRFHRTLRLPPDARGEGVRATLEDGVLTVRIPRVEPGDARTVEIE